ncbi:MAG TPA: DUF4142 domain-containing protein [Sphingomicrobium sp.]
MRFFRNFALLAVTLSLAACGGGERPVETSRSAARHPAPRPPQVPAVSDAAFVARNGSFDLFVIRSSELAQQRSSSARIRDFAHAMIADHKGTSSQLSLEGRRVNLLPSATLLPPEQGMLERLQASSSFDAEYVRDMRQAHQQAVSMDSTYSATGASPTLRPVAKSALPIEQRHLSLLAHL